MVILSAFSTHALHTCLGNYLWILILIRQWEVEHTDNNHTNNTSSLPSQHSQHSEHSQHSQYTALLSMQVYISFLTFLTFLCKIKLPKALQNDTHFVLNNDFMNTPQLFVFLNPLFLILNSIFDINYVRDSSNSIDTFKSRFFYF